MKLFKNNYKHHARVEKVAFKTGVDEQVVEEVLDTMYSYIREKLDTVDIDKDRMMEEIEFEDKFPVIRIPSLGFIKPSYKKYRHMMKNKFKKDEKRLKLREDYQKQQHEKTKDQPQGGE
jgi:hypothetical protein